MNTPPLIQVQELEQKYKKIHDKRIFLEAEFNRLEVEYKKLVKEVSEVADDSGKQKIKNTISQL